MEAKENGDDEEMMIEIGIFIGGILFGVFLEWIWTRSEPEKYEDIIPQVDYKEWDECMKDCPQYSNEVIRHRRIVNGQTITSLKTLADNVSNNEKNWDDKKRRKKSCKVKRKQKK